ncbi:MAG: hypothetical protein DI598_07570 [Pseudopedobacter saltans]|uniref:DUF2007 domain-containing protein n=1 Tax=Pseudopedobacter saltans TaxID=151895 RepID=A0A2W5F2C5_9SPHI|nr:MAG: hypothetical protein DI598_07570 [Pseudopedobacter saltans]
MDFIEIRQYNNYIPANIAKGLLEDNDIECYLQDENVSTIMPMWNIANGGVRLFVDPEKVERAELLLKKAEDQLTDEDFTMGYFSN